MRRVLMLRPANRRPRVLTIVLTAVLALVLSACGSGGGGGAGGDEPLRIGVINPFSGDFAFYGEELLRGYQLAVDEVNAEGGVMGRQVQLLPGDASTPEQGIAAVQRLGTNEGVELFVGTYISSVANTASEAAARLGLLYWDTNALANELTERGLPNFVRVGPNADAFATASVETMPAIAEAIGKPLTELRVYIEHEDSIYGTSVANLQEELLRRAGVQIVGRSAHAASATDLTGAVLRARDANPDVWLMTTYVPDGNLLLRTANAQGFTPPATVMTGTGDTQETLDAVGAEQLEGILVVSYPRPGIANDYGPGSDAFLQAYRAKYGSDIRAPQSLTAYVGMQVLLDALQAAGSTEPAAVRKAAAAMDIPPQSLANGFGVRFNENFQNTRTPPTVIQWQGGEQVTVLPEVAATGGQLMGLPRG